MGRIISCLALCTVLMGVGAACMGAEGSSVRATKDAKSVSVYDGQRLVMEYRFGEVPFKPYVRQLLTPGGMNVLRDSPEDHKHHHALMFAVGADGVDFWTETPQCGHEVNRSIGTSARSTSDGPASGGLEEKLDWVGAKGETILNETRRVTAYSGGGLGATLLTWQTELRPAEGKKSVALGGDHYFGLGVRFPVWADKIGRFSYSAGATPPLVVRGDERLVRANWCAYTVKSGDKQFSLAMFDHPDNTRHPATWFTMSQPFSYISATLNLWKEPMALREGEQLNLRYGVAAWDGIVQADEIDRVYRMWVEKFAGAKKE